MTLGRQLRRPDLPTAGARWCEAALPEGSVYRFLARERARLFPPELFADLFESTGRRSVPPSILAVVMVLQRLEGLSDREAADRFCFDVRWRYAAGVADAVAGEETASFAHTVLVDLRARNAAFTGADAEKALEAAGMITNKNAIFNDPRPPKVTSGLRLGTPAVTTRGLKEKDLVAVADFLDRALLAKDDSAALAKIRGEVAEFCKAFPMPH